MPDSISRTVKTIQIKAGTSDSGLLINKMTMQQNLEPQQGAVVPLPYYNYDSDLGQYDLGWNYDGSFIQDGDVLAIDMLSPSNFKFSSPGSLYMQISIMGNVLDGGQKGPPILVPRNSVVTEIVQYCRSGSCTITVYKGPVPCTVGTILTKNQVLSATVTNAVSCRDAIVQVRCR